jgi:hypothetical protein
MVPNSTGSCSSNIGGGGGGRNEHQDDGEGRGQQHRISTRRYIF